MIMSGVFRGLQQGMSWSQGPLVEGVWYRWVHETFGKSRDDPPVIAWPAKCLGKKSRTRTFLPVFCNTDKRTLSTFNFPCWRLVKRNSCFIERKWVLH